MDMLTAFPNAKGFAKVWLAPQHVLGLAHPQAVLFKLVLRCLGQVPELFAKQVSRAPHTGGIRLATFARSSLNHLTTFLLFILAGIQRRIHLRQVCVPALELVAALAHALINRRWRRPRAPDPRCCWPAAGR